MIHRHQQIPNAEEGELKRKAYEKDVVGRNMSQTHLRAMTLMTRIHPTTVILDVDDMTCKYGKSEKGPNSIMRKFNGKITDDSF